jgi:hypothetical protein
MADKIMSGAMKILLFIGSVLGGFLAVTLAINTLVYTPLNTAIAQEVTKRELAVEEEAKCRIGIEKEIRQEVRDGLDSQSIINQQILLGITEIKGDIKLIKATIRK